MRCFILFLCMMVLPMSLFAQKNIIAMEYFFNSDPGYGNGSQINITPGFDYEADFTVNTSTLSPGFHTLFIRHLNEDSQWGMPEARTFYVSAEYTVPEPPQISELEYFINTDPGPGSGSDLLLSASQDVIVNESVFSSDLEPGFHNLFIRSFTDQSGWGMPEAKTFYVSAVYVEPAPVPIAVLEYFIGDDPGVGEGILLEADAATDLDLTATISTADLALGSYTLIVRPMNQTGAWGFPERSTFVVGNDLRMVTFRVDMSAQAAAGFFDPNDERVYVRGSFNDFGLTELQEEFAADTNSSSKLLMQASAELLTGIYSAQVTVRGNTGDEILYRYYIASPGDSVNGTWETGTGPDDFRSLTLGEPGENIAIEPVFLNDAAPIGSFALLSPENGYGMSLSEDDTTVVTITWQISENARDYSWLLDEMDGDFSEPLLQLSSADEGTGPSVQLTIGELYGMLSATERAINDMTSLIWTVRAESANLVRYADEPFTMVINLSTTIDEIGGIPVKFALSQNYPNPFNPSTVIVYDLPVQSNIRLEVFNMIGQRVAVLVNTQQNAGRYSINFDGSGLSSGLYFYRISAGTYVETRKMMLLK